MCVWHRCKSTTKHEPVPIWLQITWSEFFNFGSRSWFFYCFSLLGEKCLIGFEKNSGGQTFFFKFGPFWVTWLTTLVYDSIVMIQKMFVIWGQFTVRRQRQKQKFSIPKKKNCHHNKKKLLQKTSKWVCDTLVCLVTVQPRNKVFFFTRCTYV